MDEKLAQWKRAYTEILRYSTEMAKAGGIVFNRDTLGPIVVAAIEAAMRLVSEPSHV